MFTKSFIVRLTMPQYSNKKISSETTILKKGYSKKLILVKQKKQSHLILIPPSQGVTLIFWGKKEMCSASPWYTIHNNYDYSCQEILGIVFWSIEGGQKARNVFIMGATFCTIRYLATWKPIRLLHSAHVTKIDQSEGCWFQIRTETRHLRTCYKALKDLLMDFIFFQIHDTIHL